jgi:hypothetical protein
MYYVKKKLSGDSTMEDLTMEQAFQLASMKKSITLMSEEQLDTCFNWVFPLYSMYKQLCAQFAEMAYGELSLIDLEGTKPDIGEYVSWLTNSWANLSLEDKRMELGSLIEKALVLIQQSRIMLTEISANRSTVFKGK